MPNLWETTRTWVDNALTPQALPVPWRRIGEAYVRCRQFLRRLELIERRRQLPSGKRSEDDRDIFSIHPRTLADLKRRGEAG
jgi:hypothetical protein